MSDTVFILGAGASKDAGCPLMGDFLDTARYLLAAGRVDDVREHFERVFRAIGNLQAVHSKSKLDLTNIESVFACFEIARTIDKFPGMPAVDFDELIRSLKVLIARTIESTLTFHVLHQNARIPGNYEKLANLISKLRSDSIPPHSVSIITFNYDLACDYALFAKKIPFRYEIGDGPETNDTEPVSLLKLHGSLNWTCGKTGVLRACRLWDCFAPYHTWHFDSDYVDVTQHLKMDPYFDRLFSDAPEQGFEPVIVPPTWNKGEYHKSVASVWSAAARELSDARNIIVIGYSLPPSDVFFHHLYALGTVGDHPLQRFWVFDTDSSGEIERRYRDLLGPGALSPVFANNLCGFKDAIPLLESALLDHV